TRPGSVSRVSRAIPSTAWQKWKPADLFRRQLAGLDAEVGEANRRARTARLGNTRCKRAPRRENAVVFLPRNCACLISAPRRRQAKRGHLHEQPDGESSSDDGDVLPSDQIAFQNPDGGSGIPFGYLRHQNADRSSWIEPEGQSVAGESAPGRVYRPNRCYSRFDGKAPRRACSRPDRRREFF